MNIKEASEPETSLLLVQNEQLWHEQTGSGALGLPHAELGAKGHLLACPPAAAHTSEDELEHKSGTKWCFGDCHTAKRLPRSQEVATQPSHKCLGTALEVPTTHQQKNAHTWPSASWLPKWGTVGYFRRQSGREANEAPSDLPSGRS